MIGSLVSRPSQNCGWQARRPGVRRLGPDGSELGCWEQLCGIGGAVTAGWAESAARVVGGRGLLVLSLVAGCAPPAGSTPARLPSPGEGQVVRRAVLDQRHRRFIAKAMVAECDLPAGVEREDPGGRTSGGSPLLIG